MKVFVSCDMEGVAGIVDWAQCRANGGAAVSYTHLTLPTNREV